MSILRWKNIRRGSSGTTFGEDIYIKCTCGAKIQIFSEFGLEELENKWNNRKPIKDMVEQLKEKKNSNPSMMFEADCWRKGIDDAIDIVRGGRE